MPTPCRVRARGASAALRPAPASRRVTTSASARDGYRNHTRPRQAGRHQPRALRRDRRPPRASRLRAARRSPAENPARSRSQHYAEHKGKPFFGELVAFITSGPVLALAVRGENAIARRPGDDGRHEPCRRGAGHDPRRPRHRAFGEHRARLRLAGEREERARALLPRRPRLSRPMSELSADARAQPRGLDAGERRVHRCRRVREAGRETEITWGVWNVPEDALGTLGDVAGLDVVELGCGTAYVSAWLARRGARPVGIDVTPAQLETARPLPGRVRACVPARSRRAPRTSRCRPRASTSPSPSTGRASGATRTAGSPKRTGCCAPAAGSWFLRNSTLSMLCAPDEGKPPETLQRATTAGSAGRVARRDRHRVAAPARRAVPPPPAHRLRRRQPRRALPAR